jgi:hypothetical protein
MSSMIIYLDSWLQVFFTWLHGSNTQTIPRLLYLASWIQGLLYLDSWIQGFFTWIHGFNTQKISLFHYHIIIIIVTSLSLLPHHHHHYHFDINDNIFSTISPFVIDGNTFHLLQ